VRSLLSNVIDAIEVVGAFLAEKTTGLRDLERISSADAIDPPTGTKRNLRPCRMFLSFRYTDSPHIVLNLGTFLGEADRIPQRNLNNAFAYDLVPSPSVITAALKAARRVNDFPTAVRIFEGTTDHPCRFDMHVAINGRLPIPCIHTATPQC